MTLSEAEAEAEAKLKDGRRWRLNFVWLLMRARLELYFAVVDMGE